MIEVRGERPGDESLIHDLNCAAFEGNGEARLVDALRASGALTLSLVAVDGDLLVGHIAFSAVTIKSESCVRTRCAGSLVS